jgi:hypothetical protein
MNQTAPGNTGKRKRMTTKKDQKPKDRSQMPSTATWATMPNAERGRPMVTMTMSAEGLAELDRRRGATPRGTFVEQLLERKRSKKAG